MRDLKIAYGNSRQTKQWVNKTITFEDLCDRLKTPVRTSETVEEYAQMPKAKRDEIKDTGGYVGGYLQDGLRQKDKVECRSFLDYDSDSMPRWFLDNIPNKACCYTTHSHTPSKPRARTIVPTTRDMTPDEFVAVSRYYAADNGFLDMIDPCSFQPQQLMYWPSCPSDGEYLFEVIDGEWLNPDDVLNAHPGWQDFSQLPTVPKEGILLQQNAKKQEDPYAKEGIVGTVCRTYTIQDVIDTYLSDVYAPSANDPNRYDYIPGEGTAGVVIYDDKFAYSHHATDPAGGKLCNAFDLVRIHRFGNLDEKESYRCACDLFQQDDLVQKRIAEEKQLEAGREFISGISTISPEWETPIPFDEFTLPAFPVDALPASIGNYVTALAESTQTPVDMAAASAIAILSVCMQGKFRVRAKPDWTEPVNTFVMVVMNPSERKSAVESAMVRPLNVYEAEQNVQNAAAMESSRMRKRILERRQKALEEQAAKGKADEDEIEKIAEEIAEYREIKPLKLYVDDITTEKLTSVLADNDGKAAILSTEGGIFDILAGTYSKMVNIDVMLKGYSGDSIRVDRIGRASESILNPALTVLLMVQPSVLSGLMQNGTFRGRGLTARFLYAMPKSYVGSRQYRTASVEEDAYREYERTIRNILEDEDPETVTLSPEADRLIEEFSMELEPKLRKEYAGISDWAGKLVGNVLRISALLCRASTWRSHDFLDTQEPLVVEGKTMADAIRIGRYMLVHAEAAYALMGADTTLEQCRMVFNILCDRKLKEFSCRDVMRVCRSFKKAEDVRRVLDRLIDYGYVEEKPMEPYSGKGRPRAQRYLLNPSVLN